VRESERIFGSYGVNGFPKGTAKNFREAKLLESIMGTLANTLEYTPTEGNCCLKVATIQRCRYPQRSGRRETRGNIDVGRQGCATSTMEDDSNNEKRIYFYTELHNFGLRNITFPTMHQK